MPGAWLLYALERSARAARIATRMLTSASSKARVGGPAYGYTVTAFRSYGHSVQHLWRQASYGHSVQHLWCQAGSFTYAGRVAVPSFTGDRPDASINGEVQP